MERMLNSRLIAKYILILSVFILVPIISSCGGSSSEEAVSRLALWEPPPVVTIYFAGTGMTEDQWQGTSASWDEELVATLHKWQETSDIHKKTFIDGVGTGCEHSWDWFDILDLINQGFPGLEMCRGWETNLAEAEDFLMDEALPALEGDVILNLVGFSRGAVTTMMFANRVAVDSTLNSRVEKINILAFDPVAGDTSLSPDEFVLPQIVAQYVGVYSTDERAAMFSPSLPEFESFGTRYWTFRLPGAHETMVGNPETDGHSTNINLGCGILWLEECTDSELLDVSWVTTFIAENLLGSSQWGGLTFDMQELENWHSGISDDDSEDQFQEKVDTLWDYDYSGMRKFSANILLGFESCQWDPDTLTLTYTYYAALDWLFLGGFNYERCTDWFHYDYSSADMEAARQRQLLEMETVWDRQLLETGPFVWVDPLNNGEDALAMLRDLGNSVPLVDPGGPYESDEGSAISFDASGSVDPDSDPLQYRWDFDDDGTWDTEWSDNPTAEYTFGDDHSGTASVQVSDGDIATMASATVTINNVAPEAIIDSIDQPNPHFILPDVHTLLFNGSFSDPGWMDVHTSSWDFGDGTTLPGTVVEENVQPDATGTSAAHYTYGEPGSFTVELRVEDDDGGVVSETNTVEVITAGQACGFINDYIQALPVDAFKNNAGERKNTFSNKMRVIEKMVSGGKYHPTVSKLLHDVRAKTSGSVDGDPENDWITDPAAQTDICMMIDDLAMYLE